MHWHAFIFSLCSCWKNVLKILTFDFNSADILLRLNCPPQKSGLHPWLNTSVWRHYLWTGPCLVGPEICSKLLSHQHNKEQHVTWKSFEDVRIFFSSSIISRVHFAVHCICLMLIAGFVFPLWDLRLMSAMISSERERERQMLRQRRRQTEFGRPVCLSLPEQSLVFTATADPLHSTA